MWVCVAVSSVQADFSVISEVEYNLTASAERVLFTTADKYFLALVVEPKTANQNDHRCSVLVFETLNGTLMQQPSSSGNSLQIGTSNVQFFAKKYQSIDEGRYLIETRICTVETCIKVFVFEDQGVSLSTEGNINLCSPRNTSTAALQALTQRSNQAIYYVYTENNEVLGTICDDPARRQLRFSCSDSDKTLNTVKDAFIKTSGDSVKIFGLLSSGDTTALCVFSFGLSSLGSAGVTDIAEKSSRVLPGTTGSAIGLKVADAEQGHLAYVMHTNGLIAKVSIRPLLVCYAYSLLSPNCHVCYKTILSMLCI